MRKLTALLVFGMINIFISIFLNFVYFCHPLAFNRIDKSFSKEMGTLLIISSFIAHYFLQLAYNTIHECSRQRRIMKKDEIIIYLNKIWLSSFFILLLGILFNKSFFPSIFALNRFLGGILINFFGIIIDSAVIVVKILFFQKESKKISKT